MAQISDDIEWVVGGTSALAGTYRGKQEVLGFWGKLAEAGFRNTTAGFLADGDQVAVLVTNSVGEDSVDAVDILDFGADGTVVHFQGYGDSELLDRAFPR
jgi:ketosteroid isomerase-like protein